MQVTQFTGTSDSRCTMETAKPALETRGLKCVTTLDRSDGGSSTPPFAWEYLRRIFKKRFKA
jgi:hypothetical protein